MKRVKTYLCTTTTLITLSIILNLFLPHKSNCQEGYAKDVKERVLRLPQCSKPIGTITARSFKCKAAACQGDRVYFGPGWGIEFSTKALGDGLADMLITALANTNCFKVVERLALEEIKEELELMGVKPKGTIKTADFIVTGAVTALELKASGIGGGGIIIPLPFGLGAKVGKSTAYIGLDMRLIDVKSSEILTAKTVEGKSERWNFGLAAGGLFGKTIGGAYLDAIKNTPLEEATRDLIVKAVSLVVESVKDMAPQTIKIGEKEIYYNEKGEVIREEIKGLDKTSKSYAEEVVRENLDYKPYKKILWEEDFLKCKLVPTTVKITKGHGECVSFKGKKWMASTKGDVVFEKSVTGFNPSKNWSFEAKIYYSPKGYEYDHKITFFVGKTESPISLHLPKRTDSWKWSAYPNGIPIPNEANLPNDLSGQEIKVAIKKEGEKIHVFVNDIRSLSVPVDTPSLSALTNKLVIKLTGNDIGKGEYVLVTNLKLTQE
ncbi:MAG: CsgG/HfaB family protein [candidate division WOR-3 bacterium]